MSRLSVNILGLLILLASSQLRGFDAKDDLHTRIELLVHWYEQWHGTALNLNVLNDRIVSIRDVDDRRLVVLLMKSRIGFAFDLANSKSLDIVDVVYYRNEQEWKSRQEAVDYILESERLEKQAASSLGSKAMRAYLTSQSNLIVKEDIINFFRSPVYMPLNSTKLLPLMKTLADYALRLVNSCGATEVSVPYFSSLDPFVYILISSASSKCPEGVATYQAFQGREWYEVSSMKRVDVNPWAKRSADQITKRIWIKMTFQQPPIRQNP
jgi:hypothetical protein